MQSEPLDEAERLARELSEYTDHDEVTANVHVHMPSQPDSDPPAKQIKHGLLALGTGIGLALVGALAALIKSCVH